MVIDCFPFGGYGAELDLLEIRLNELKNVVDFHVLVESTKTQTSLDKPLYFEQNRDRYKDFSHKIVQVTVDEFPKFSYPWGMEHFQRNNIIQGIRLLLERELITEENAIILISDLDEIPNPQILKSSLKNLNGQISFNMSFNPFYVNFFAEKKDWIGTTAIKLSEAIKNNLSPQDIRNVKDYCSVINGGWHFCYQGGKETVYKKFFNCIEPIDKSKILPLELFEQEFDKKIKEGGSFLFSDKEDNSIKLIKYNEEYLPEYLKENRLKFSNLFYV